MYCVQAVAMHVTWRRTSDSTSLLCSLTKIHLHLHKYASNHGNRTSGKRFCSCPSTLCDLNPHIAPGCHPFHHFFFSKPPILCSKFLSCTSKCVLPSSNILYSNKIHLFSSFQYHCKADGEGGVHKGGDCLILEKREYQFRVVSEKFVSPFLVKAFQWIHAFKTSAKKFKTIVWFNTADEQLTVITRRVEVKIRQVEKRKKIQTWIGQSPLNTMTSLGQIIQSEF